MKRFKMIAVVYLFFLRENKILLLRRQNTGYEDDNYSVTAGHVDDNESLYTAAIREAKEETGLDLSKNDISLVHIMHKKEKDIRMDFFFTAKKWKGEPKNTEPNLCSDLRWFPTDHLPKNIIGHIKQAINSYQNKSYQNKLLYSEIGW